MMVNPQSYMDDIREKVYKERDVFTRIKLIIDATKNIFLISEYYKVILLSLDIPIVIQKDVNETDAILYFHRAIGAKKLQINESTIHKVSGSALSKLGFSTDSTKNELIIPVIKSFKNLEEGKIVNEIHKTFESNNLLLIKPLNSTQQYHRCDHVYISYASFLNIIAKQGSKVPYNKELINIINICENYCRLCCEHSNGLAHYRPYLNNPDAEVKPNKIDKIYIIKNTGFDNVYKIGVTYNITKRLRGLQVGNHNLLKCILLLPVKDPYKVEKEIHEKYDDERLRGEWFAIDDIQKCIDKITLY